MTGTLAAMPLTSPAFSNWGLSMEGMPSFGGPPLIISSKLTEVLEKSVFGHSNFQMAGLAEALLNPMEIKKAEISPAANTGAIDDLMRENEIMAHSFCCDAL